MEIRPRTGTSPREVTMAFYMYLDNQGRWRWRLTAGNNRVIADSGQGYINKQDCRDAIALVQSSASAPVYES